MGKAIKTMNLPDKFKERPIDDETNILGSQAEKFDVYDVLLELWNWGGIAAQSAALIEDQLENMDDDDIIKLLPLHLELGENKKW